MFCMSKVVADECNLGYSEDDVPGKKMDLNLCLLLHMLTAVKA